MYQLQSFIVDDYKPGKYHVNTCLECAGELERSEGKTFLADPCVIGCGNGVGDGVAAAARHLCDACGRADRYERYRKDPEKSNKQANKSKRKNKKCPGCGGKHTGNESDWLPNKAYCARVNPPSTVRCLERCRYHGGKPETYRCPNEAETKKGGSQPCCLSHRSTYVGTKDKSLNFFTLHKNFYTMRKGL